MKESDKRIDRFEEVVNLAKKLADILQSYPLPVAVYAFSWVDEILIENEKGWANLRISAIKCLREDELGADESEIN